jgi:riboflavin kinase/FMN adenylyltransferase
VQWIVQAAHPQLVVEGGDFRFGKGRAGDIEVLRTLGTSHGFSLIVVDPVTCVLSDCSVVPAASSMVRWLLGHGRVRDAAIMLGRPYELIAAIRSGDKFGRSIGVPTANLEHSDFLLPADGIYSGTAIVPDGREFPAAISVGTKPTFGQRPRVCEAHLLGFDGPLDDYGWTIHLRFTDWIRDQVAFASVTELVEQLHRDIACVAASCEEALA